jgi:hypothetical protein
VVTLNGRGHESGQAVDFALQVLILDLEDDDLLE